ncbi:hypothetical protein DAEQUDRAFT_51580 [Daedalea quercina L-15889]|uniref:CHAT domain-containing protein n=1 Tax=Daedalea quercina L-15889 TaxID=1314783 RepID=A0A165L9M8_9APHY|nr:hypothetical protein DAEQUDRAFT_51580 [Daedalea quercina L-15889]
MSKPTDIIEPLQENIEKLNDMALEGLQWASEHGNDLLLERWVAYMKEYSSLNIKEEDKAFMLEMAGFSYIQAYEKDPKRLQYLELGKDLYLQSLRLLPNAGALWHLGVLCGMLFKKTGKAADMDECITYKKQSIEYPSQENHNKAGLLYDVARSYEMKFQVSNDLADIQGAIAMYKQAAELTAAGAKQSSKDHFVLGSAYERSYQKSNDPSDLNAAIASYEEAVKFTPARHQERAFRLSALALALKSRHQLTGSGEMVDMHKAITLLTEALELTPQNKPERVLAIHTLAHAHLHCFEYTGQLANIEQSISYFQQAIALSDVMSLGENDKVHELSGLGDAYRHRFELLGEISDLHHAIEALEKAYHLSHGIDGGQHLMLLYSASGYHTLFRKHHNKADLQKAIDLYKEVVSLPSEENSEYKSVALSCLGAAYFAYFNATKDIAYVDLALEPMEQNLTLLPEHNSRRAHQLSNMGNVYSLKFELLHELPDIDKAINLIQQAVELLPRGHPDIIASYLSLANACHEKMKHITDENEIKELLQRALLASKSVATCGYGSAYSRLNACIQWADAAEHLKDCFHEYIEAYDTFFLVLPEVIWLGKTVSKQYEDLVRWNHEANHATSVAIRLGEFNKAIEWLEQGRSVVWNQLLELRSPLDDLKSAHPATYAKLKGINKELEVLNHTRDNHDAHTDWEAIGQLGVHDHARDHHHDHTDWELMGQHHRKLAIARDELISEIRTLPGFEGFLRAKPFTVLHEVAQDYPVVLLNMHSKVCHPSALILSPEHDNIETLHLTKLPLKVLEKMSSSLQGLLAKHGRNAERNVARAAEMVPLDDSTTYSFHGILKLLWTGLVKPILKKLGYSDISLGLDAKPHIWWCVTGLLSFLPLHAAGDYSKSGPGHKLSDYAVSSYTPSIAALTKARKKTVPAVPKLLAICQIQAKGYNALPAVAQEWNHLEEISHNYQMATENLHDNDATTKHVLEKIQMASWVHFACHGTQDPIKPTDSAFILYDDRLSLSKITQQNLDQADFAFLSACHTATGDLKLSEQAVHLAAGMLFAGFRSVIATMWSIRDEDGPDVARDVYSHLCKFKDSSQAAYALHKAVENLRKKHPGTEDADLLAWTPFIHLGC